MIVTFDESAKAELAQAVTHYNDRASGLGDALASEVRSVLARILQYPEAGFLVRPNVRRRLLPHFPYSVLYSADDERLRVLAIMHHRREPDYWSGRR